MERVAEPRDLVLAADERSLEPRPRSIASAHHAESLDCLPLSLQLHVTEPVELEHAADLSRGHWAEHEIT